jgi:hypothetical protein
LHFCHISRFPDNAVWREKWFDALKDIAASFIVMHQGRLKQSVLMDLYICSVHFEYDCFSDGFSKPNSVPARFLKDSRSKQVTGNKNFIKFIFFNFFFFHWRMRTSLFSYQSIIRFRTSWKIRVSNRSHNLKSA